MRATRGMAGLVLCVMASLAGVPPFLGFWAKLVVLRAALDGGHGVAGARRRRVLRVIGAFYYLRVVKVMYFDEPVGELPPIAQGPRGAASVFGSQCAGLAGAGDRVEPDHGVVPAGLRRLNPARRFAGLH